MTGNLKNFAKFLGTKQDPSLMVKSLLIKFLGTNCLPIQSLGLLFITKFDS